MADERSGYKHDSSDKKLDQAGTSSDAGQLADKPHKADQGHVPDKIGRHDDAGKDRLFEHREQHDDAEKESEKTRLAKDVAQHHHPDKV